MKKMNFYFSRIGMLATLLVLAGTAKLLAQCSPINFTYPAQAGVCPANATLDVAGITGEEISRNGGLTWVTATNGILPTDIGTTLQYRGTQANGATCWSTVLIEDKTGPTVTPPTDRTLVCSDPNAAALSPTAGTATGTPTTVDCSSVTSTYYTDVVVSTGCGNVKVVNRTWFAKDKWGNVGQATTVQVITVTRAFDDINVASPDYRGASDPKIGLRHIVTFDCAATSTVTDGPYVNVTGGTANPVLLKNGICGLSARAEDGPVIPICPGTRKFERTWIVTDLCGTVITTPSMVDTFKQLIILEDKTTPAVRVNFNTWSLSNVASDFCSTIMPAAPQLRRASVREDSVSYTAVGLTTAGTISISATPVNITPRASATMCNAAEIGAVRLTLTSTDNCSGIKSIIVSDNRFAYSATTRAVTNTVVLMGNASFTVTVIDSCDNAVRFPVNVTLEDNVSPTATCDDIEMTIDGQTLAVLTAASINRNSFDNCGVVRIFIRKAQSPATPVNTQVTYAGADTWCDLKTYDCSDVDQNRMVDVLYVDGNGNYMMCCVPIKLIFKGRLTCAPGVDIPRVCSDNLTVADLVRIFDGATTAQKTSFSWNGCGDVTTTVGLPGTLTLDCGAGSVSRSITYTVGTGAAQQTAVCNQRIVVTPVRGFRVRRLADENLTCSGATTSLETDRLQVVNNLSLWHSDPAATTNQVQYPNQSVRTCSGPVVEAEEWTYSNAEFCKVIVRTFTIKDICQFSGDRTVNDIFRFKTSLAAAQTGTDTLESVVVSGGHIVRFTRTIRIRDNQAPTPTTTAIADICDGINNTTTNNGDTDNALNCKFNFRKELTATDGCGTREYTSLFYAWTIQNAAGAIIHNGQGPIVTGPTGGLDFGTYTIRYTVSDLCGNLIHAPALTVKGSDCKAPEIRIHDKIVALAGQTGVRSTGMGFIEYADIRNWIQDECDLTLTVNTNKIYMQRTTVALPSPFSQTSAPVGFTGTYNGGRPGIMLNCDDIPAGANQGTVGIRVWTNDAAGNWNYAVSTVTVQDNDRICENRVGQISGLTTNEAGTAIDNVNMTARVAGATVSAGVTEANGSFTLSVPTRGSNVQVSATKSAEVDAREGVSTADIAAISRHILGSQNLSSAYSIIAADVDKNGSVEAADMLQIRRFVLFISPALPAGSFRFVDKAYTFRNAAEPLAEDFPEVINVANIQGNVTANFTAVKLGDVNNSYRHVSVRGSRSLMLTANDMDVIAGNEYTVNVNAANFDAAAFQGTFSFNGLTVKAIKAGNLSNMSDANFGQFNNAVTASWNGKAAGAADVVAITFVANKSGKLSEMMSFGSAMTAAEAVATNGEVLNVSLKFNTGKVSGSEFALYQNTPNPVATSTKVGFNLPKDGAARFTVFNAEGKVLFAKNGDYKAGYNEVILNKSELAAGVLYYRLETADHSATKKMIIIE